MSQIKFYAGSSDEVNQHEIEDGSFYFATDTGIVYIDLNNERKGVNSYTKFEYTRIGESAIDDMVSGFEIISTHHS